MIFTGSVVVDEHNSSGFCVAGKPCMVAVFTAHKTLPGGKQHEMQSLAFSLDRGRTWKLFQGNPVLDLGLSNFRDPGVFWDAERQRWVMAVALPDDHKVQLYRSDNLKHWTLLSTFGPEAATGGQWECPNLIRLPDHGGVHLWALKVGLNPGSLQGGSGEQYFLGRFDGTTFVPLAGEQSHGWSDYGKDAYCAISFNHLPEGSPPVLLGWMNNWQYADKVPTSPWRGQMTLPRRLSSISVGGGYTLSQQPDVRSLRQGREQPFTTSAGVGAQSGNLFTMNVPMELEVSFGLVGDQQAGLRFYSDEAHWTEVGFDRLHKIFYVDRRHAGQMVAAQFPARTEAPYDVNRPANLHLIADRSSVEAFAQDGTIAMTNLIFPPSEHTAVKAFASGGSTSVAVKGRAWRLQSIWTRQ
jgi:fructan beta-fructosidase